MTNVPRRLLVPQVPALLSWNSVHFKFLSTVRRVLYKGSVTKAKSIDRLNARCVVMPKQHTTCYYYDHEESLSQ